MYFELKKYINDILQSNQLTCVINYVYKVGDYLLIL
jgi:hypothetical protein